MGCRAAVACNAMLHIHPCGVTTWLRFLPLTLGPVLLCQCVSMRPEGDTAQAQREFIDSEARKVIEKLEKEAPESAEEIAEAEGYAAFRYKSGRLPFWLTGLGGGSGYGVAVDNADEDRTYMKVSKFNWGMGMALSEMSVVFVFSDREAFDEFRHGTWDSGPAAEVTVKADEVGGGIGGAVITQDGFKAYNLTDSGVSYGVSYKARRFTPIGPLN